MRIDPGTYLFAALLLLVLPGNWVAASVFAAIIHELCHVAMIRILGGDVTEIRIGIGGVQMDVRLPGIFSEMLAALAGPVGSFLLLIFWRFLPEVAVCGCIQGGYNLLPVYPLDGGRALHCLLSGIYPQMADKILRFIECICLVLILFVTILAFCRHSFGIWLFGAGVFFVFGRIRRKIPCKRGQIGVQ